MTQIFADDKALDLATFVAAVKSSEDWLKRSGQREKIYRRMDEQGRLLRLYKTAHEKIPWICGCCNGVMTHTNIERGTEAPETETYNCATCYGKGKIDISNS